MTDLDRVLESAAEWYERGVDFALATVVGVRGSTYRGLAARQLVGADDRDVGTVSGGCLDQDLHRVAHQVMESGTPQFVEFDLTADDEAVWGWGIGCNGATELVVEPADSVMALIRTLRASSRPVAVLHHLDGDVGRRRVVTRSDAGPFADEVAAALDEGLPRIAIVGEERVMIEVVGAARRLVVCGAGHDAAPLVRFAAELGYEPVVVDDRRPFLSEDRFPDASDLLRASAEDLATTVALDASSVVVVMSHNYLRDVEYVAAAFGHGVPYIGVLGPGERLQRILDDLAERGVTPSDADRAALHGPAGLDIGAEGPVEIAWSVMAEILAVRRGATAGFLRDRKGPDAVRGYDRGT